LDEAQTLLPVLGDLLERARAAASRAGGLQEQMQELSQRIFLSGGLHVDVPAAARRRAEHDKALTQARSLIGEIEEIGANVGSSDAGLLEFPCAVEDRTVLLCWRLGETEIEYWREEEEGSPLRRIDDGTFGPGPDRLN
jgi:hypothetical protein